MASGVGYGERCIIIAPLLHCGWVAVYSEHSLIVPSIIKSSSHQIAIGLSNRYRAIKSPQGYQIDTELDSPIHIILSRISTRLALENRHALVQRIGSWSNDFIL